METENNNKNGYKKALITFALLIVAFLVYYSVMLVISPVRKLASIQEEFSRTTSEETAVDERKYSDSTYLRLLKERSFLQSRVAMAETDSIYLTINLTDSTANLEISGVVVHRAVMSEIKTSKILLKGDENIILNYLASPFTISSDYSTIRKNPVMVKIAPKDTSEYVPDVIPDTSLVEPVNYILELTGGTRIYIYQSESDKPSERMNIFIFDIQARLRDTWIALKSVLKFKVPEYHPYIKMRIPRADAKIIYRAIPRNGQIGIYR
jgi:hypothetical protein